uniref:serine/threonine-protein kinase n=1 Tax=Nonomuraea pusilla TaxID=46177 RepID=UPI0009EA4F42|nr:serine/threonine-protein kinase [Nonomuraea pusilla]
MPGIQVAVIAGRYQLVELIGRGGMGEVWRGLDRHTGVPVAVKLLNPLVSGIAAHERFAREARAAAQVVHPNVVALLDVGHDDQRRFLVMELLTGHNLADELAARGPLPVPEACALLAQAAAGLAAAHRAGVVHRDVKPANLHLTSDRTLKVVDFGLAHLAGEAARLTAVGTVVGTAAYLAPEQIEGSGGHACDVYALGCVAYELLCGQPPFTGAAPQVMYQHLHHGPVPPSRHRADIPAELERLVMAMLAKNPSHRPATADQAAHHFATYAQHRPQGEPGAGGGRPPVQDGSDSTLPVLPPLTGSAAPPPPNRPDAQTTVLPSVAGPGAPGPGPWTGGAPSTGPWTGGAPSTGHPPARTPSPPPPGPGLPTGGGPLPPPPGPGIPPGGASRAGDTAILEAVPPEPPAPPGPAMTPPPGTDADRDAGRRQRRRVLLHLALAAVGAAIITLLSALLFSSASDEEKTTTTGSSSAVGAARPSPSTTSSRPAARRTPRPGATPSTPRATSAGQDRRTWLVNLDQAVDAQQRIGNIDPDVARKAHEKIRKAAEKLVEGDAEDAGEKIEELTRDLREAWRKGELRDGPLVDFLARAGLDVTQDPWRGRHDRKHGPR